MRIRLICWLTGFCLLLASVAPAQTLMYRKANEREKREALRDQRARPNPNRSVFPSTRPTSRPSTLAVPTPVPSAYQLRLMRIRGQLPVTSNLHDPLAAARETETRRGTESAEPASAPETEPETAAPESAESVTATPAEPPKPAEIKPRENQGARPQVQTLAGAQRQTELTKRLQALSGRETISAAQRVELADGLMGLAGPNSRPSAGSIDRLASLLAGAIEGTELSEFEAADLVKDLNQVLNAATVPMDQVRTAIGDAQAILMANRATPQTTSMFVEQMRSIALEIQRNAPK